jgi:hypothetical protein
MSNTPNWIIDPPRRTAGGVAMIALNAKISADADDALATLARRLGVVGERGTYRQALVRHIAALAQSVPDELLAALTAVGMCADGWEWPDAVEVAFPWPELNPADPIDAARARLRALRETRMAVDERIGEAEAALLALLPY